MAKSQAARKTAPDPVFQGIAKMNACCKLTYAAACGLFLFIGACQSESGKKSPSDIDTMNTNLDDYKPIAAAAAKSVSLVLLEGLPHQFEEREVLAKELKEKKTVSYHGFAFYEEALELKPEDAKQIAAILADTNSFGRGPAENYVARITQTT
jgi:hypothetical protein